MEQENLTLIDENGNELALSIVEIFDLEDKHYAILMKPIDMDAAEPGPSELYVMRMDALEDGGVEFVVPEEDELPAVIEKASQVLNEAEAYGGGCAPSDCAGCQCGCGHSHEEE